MAIPAIPAHGASWDSWAAGIDGAARNAAQLPDVATAGTPTGDALRAAYAPVGRMVLTAYDDFTTRPDGALTGTTPVGGYTWNTTGASLPAIASGRLASAGVGYAYLGLPSTPTMLACGVEFTNPDTSAPMTMAWVTGPAWDLTNLIGHFNFGGTGFNLTLKRGGTFYTLMAGDWKRPLAAGVVHTASVAIVGDSFVVQVDGEEYASPPDSRTRALVGSYVMWEPNTTGASQAKLSWVGAWTLATAGAPLAAAIAPRLAQYTQASQGRIAGSRNEMWEASLGRTPVAGQPGIAFGAATIVTELVAAVSAGATTLSTRQPIPDGSTVVIDQAAAAEETRTSSGYPSGSGPYVVTVTAALTSAHPVGTVVVATVPAQFRAEMYLSQANGFWYMPNVPVVTFPGEKVYLGNDLTQFLYRVVPGVVGSDGVGAGKGAFRASAGWTTAGRPLPADAGRGSQGYDTTLSIPIWSDGTNWRNAAGTIV